MLKIKNYNCESRSQQEIDFSSLPAPTMLGKTSVNLSAIEFTTIAYQETFQLLGPWPKEESRLVAVIRPYSYEVRKKKRYEKLKKINNNFILL